MHSKWNAGQVNFGFELCEPVIFGAFRPGRISVHREKQQLLRIRRCKAQPHQHSRPARAQAIAGADVDEVFELRPAEPDAIGQVVEAAKGPGASGAANRRGPPAVPAANRGHAGPELRPRKAGLRAKRGVDASPYRRRLKDSGVAGPPKDAAGKLGGQPAE